MGLRAEAAARAMCPAKAAPMRAIVDDASVALGIPPHKLTGTSKELRCVQARYAIAWAARTALGFSHPRIARSLFASRVHSSSIHAFRRAEDLIPRDPAFARLARQLAARALNRSFDQ